MDFRAILIALVVLVSSCPAYAISPGQIDNFQDGTTQNWTNGGAPGVPPVVNVPTGGPGGAGDRYIQVTSVSSAPGNRLTTFNRMQWLGNYIAAGVTTIEMDLENLSDISLSIRIAFKVDLTPSSAGYLSLPVVLAAGGGWQHAVFSLSQANLIALGGPPDYNTFFSSGIVETRIINEVGDTNLNGDIVVGQLGIDNIHAVPEPNSFLLSTIGFIAVVLTGLWRKRAILRGVTLK